jgi:plasmid maintenance system antidote protein VapI
MFDTSKLRGRIYEKFGSQTKFAEALGVSISTVNHQLKNPSNFSRETISKWVDTLEIAHNEIGDYFFTIKE